MTRCRLMVALGVIATMLALGGCIRRLPCTPADCSPEQTEVVVDTSRHALSLCEHGRVAGWWGVRLGSNGVGKRHEGDRRTPLGRYVLGAPVSSPEFGVFVPIAYPTPEQRQAGFTGSAVGVHGPGRTARWVGPIVNLIDTTAGCIGIATDDDMLAISAWLHAHPHTTIVIR